MKNLKIPVGRSGFADIRKNQYYLPPFLISVYPEKSCSKGLPSRKIKSCALLG